ncbi:metal-sensing transcriptional repressor [Tabrizicola soli]|uniref:Metal-sensing transcriptional repressor n=1 Tax=Tabrizicola soli TaxID=2185115 RepID=A0ABV7DQP8_9RHOB|nr:metal-sensing transcriptional repressor [Tabrizicola soli]
MTETALHRSHPDIINRLKRAEGHLRSIIAMLEAGKPCAEIANQLKAVENAITAAKRTLIHDHIDHCLGLGGEDELAELRAMARLL